MEFESRICTTKEEGKKLIELGLKPETADMVWHYTNSRSESMKWELRPHRPTLRTTTHLNVDKLNVFGHKNEEGKVMTGEEYFDKLWGNDIPAWSLHRLMEIGNFEGIAFLDIKKAFPIVIDHIESLVRFKRIKKEYLK